ncbi:response regulator transcription factor [Cohnella lupini]|uniref:Two-component system response regulator YesN n=1 Tax=Cohnella lupini TaxID=1294267 RepID=A0A3D9ITB4_9BACL|nr:response regulator [Cohnella lupini]RED64968.1 two-component system response regulator YesN [Cohnella lupini]
MFSIYLVEDEIIELDLLINYIDWESMGIRVIGSAKNGRIAWKQIQTLQPDIVLSDVRMPIMDGLRLASLIQEQFDWMKIVFLSGHDEFAYVKSALSAGAVGYLLKPVNPGELSEVMSKVKEEVEKANLLRRSKQMLAEKNIGNLLSEAGGESAQETWHELTRLDPRYLSQEYVGALVQVDDPHALPEATAKLLKEQEDPFQVFHSQLEAFSLSGTIIRLGANRWFLAVPAAEGTNLSFFWLALSESIRKTWEWTATIGVCEKAGLLRQSRDMLKEAEKAVDERFYRGSGNVIYSGNVQAENEELDNLEVQALPEKLQLSDLPDAEEEAGRIFDSMVRLRIPRKSAYRVTSNLIQAIFSELYKYEDWADRGFGDSTEWNQEVARIETVAGMKSFVLNLLERAGGYLEEKHRDRHAMLVQQVAGIIDNEYPDALTIDYLAGRVYLSPNYLRVLFKEKKGCTVHEYLTKVRLQKALGLLRDRKLKIHDVARNVGFDNTSYFCSFFYKNQGVTPNEYRKKFL